jgi:hypothetical protein
MKLPVFFLLIFIISCTSGNRQFMVTDFAVAVENGRMANEGLLRCQRYVYDWLEYADPVSGLIPRDLAGLKDIWNAQDAAADNYPFMVLTAAITDKELFDGRMHEILEAEQRLTNRIDRLPDNYSFSRQGFAREELNLDNIIFGASEYVKDGLLPLTEYLGPSPWSERMTGLIDDIWKHAAYETPFGIIPSLNVEVNGEMLQALSRVYRMTGDKKYLEWAVRLGDYYLLGQNHPTRDLHLLRLRDHGCEIVSGLSELYIITAYDLPEKRDEYQKPVYEMLDRILETGRNEHGLFYNQVDPVSGEIIDGNIADNFGYTYNAFYSVYMLDNYTPYRDAVLKGLANLTHYRDYNWENQSSDGFADAIEGALNLYNREPLVNTGEWVENEIMIMWSLQDSARRPGTEAFRGNGIIEGWHGDGNFARTTIMFCLWKTQGVTMEPWKSTLTFGADWSDDMLKIAISSEKPWEGTLRFDVPRHQTIFNLPIDYPRINQFPEWFTVKDNKQYKIMDMVRGNEKIYTAAELSDGIQLKVKEGQKILLMVREI